MVTLASATVVGAILGGLLASGRGGATNSTRGGSTAAFGVVIGAILGLVFVGSVSTLPGFASGAGPGAADGQPAGRESRMPTIIELNAASNFDAYIQRATVPVLVDFWAPWCGPCRRQGQILHNLESRLRGRAVVLKVNVDRHQGLARRFGVRAIPTLIVFDRGRQKQRMQGMQSPRALYSALGL